MTKTTINRPSTNVIRLWFAQNSLPLRWQRQHLIHNRVYHACCDLLKIHYLCGDKDNRGGYIRLCNAVVICSKFITFAVTKTTISCAISAAYGLWFAQNSLPLRWQRQLQTYLQQMNLCCDLLKIHYLCGDKDNRACREASNSKVVICSKFITFAVTKTTRLCRRSGNERLWFAQNSLPLRWQRQLQMKLCPLFDSCDLLKIHYLCGDKDNQYVQLWWERSVVICSKFITFAVTKTTKD